MPLNSLQAQAAQKGVDGLVKAQRGYEAWMYYGKDASKHRPYNDTSITIWAAMALKSAKVSGLKVDGNAFAGTQAIVKAVEKLAGVEARQIP